MKDLRVKELSSLCKLAACALTAALFLIGCGEEPKQETLLRVPAIKVGDLSSLSNAPFPGRANAGQEVNLSFRVSGPLVEFPVEVGDEVEQGQLLAMIDPQDYINAVGTAKGQLDRAMAAAQRAEGDYRRINNVYKEDPGATSETALDLAKAARDASLADVKSVESTLKTVEDQLKYTSLLSPFAGVVVATYADNFETVLAKQPIMRVVDPSSIEFIINVPETSIAYVQYVEDISVKFDAFPDVEVKAQIKEIGREASQSTRTYPVTLIMKQPEGVEILPGMAGLANVSARLPEDAVKVGYEIPATALFSQEDPAKSYVWIINEDERTLSSREVIVGRLTNTGVLVKSGIQPGEWVVVRGVNSVSEGMRVRIEDFSSKEAP